MIRLLLADDHPIIRQGLRQILEDIPDISVAAEAGSGDETMQKAAADDFDVVILDISMPGKNWLDVIRESKIMKPRLVFLVLSRHADLQYALTSLKAGASGYLTKNNVANELIGAIRKVYSGGNYISPDLAGKMAQDAAAGVSTDKLPHELLSPNEFKVLCMIIQGKTIKQIAEELSLGQSTVSTYKSRILQKMNISNDADLTTAIAREMKLEDARIDDLRTAAVIHDIGKMNVPSDILSKPGRLSDMELQLIRTHAQGSHDIVKGMDFPGVIAQTVLQHHERLDGSGYPNQLKGEDLLLEAKILAVADVIEAMASHRPYRPALGIDKALEEISKNRDKLYDVDVVDACLKLFKNGKFEFKTV